MRHNILKAAMCEITINLHELPHLAQKNLLDAAENADLTLKATVQTLLFELLLLPPEELDRLIQAADAALLRQPVSVQV